MDFYKSDDLRVYLNKFKKEIIKIYLSKQNPDINPCIENEGIFKLDLGEWFFKWDSIKLIYQRSIAKSLA